MGLLGLWSLELAHKERILVPTPAFVFLWEYLQLLLLLKMAVWTILLSEMLLPWQKPLTTGRISVLPRLRPSALPLCFLSLFYP